MHLFVELITIHILSFKMYWCIKSIWVSWSKVDVLLCGDSVGLVESLHINDLFACGGLPDYIFIFACLPFSLCFADILSCWCCPIWSVIGREPHTPWQQGQGAPEQETLACVCGSMLDWLAISNCTDMCMWLALDLMSFVSWAQLHVSCLYIHSSEL